MSEAISTTRLAEIRQLDAAFDTTKPHPFPTRVYAHRRALLAEVDRLTTALAELEELGTEAYAEKLLGQARLRSMEIRSGSFEMDLTEAQEMAAAYVAMCRTMLGDAENYTETPVGFPTAKTEFTVKIAESPVDWYVLTVQRKWKLTPHEARQRAEADRDQARARVAELEAERERSFALMKRLVGYDIDRCKPDHFGLCLRHEDGDERCINRMARRFVAAAALDRSDGNESDRRAENGPASESAGQPADLREPADDSAECLLSGPTEAHRSDGNAQ